MLVSVKKKKSVNVSDNLNQIALEVVNPFLTGAYIYQRPTYHKKDTSLDNMIMQQVLMLQSYIYPLKTIIQDLRQANPTVNMKLHICLDETDLNANLDNEYFASKLLTQITENINETDHITFTYQTFDSQQELGIQMADMLVGAYRKEQKYSASDDQTKIIPFQVKSMVDNLDFGDNDIFLKLFGFVSFTMKKPKKKDLVNFKKILKDQLNLQKRQKTINLNSIKTKLSKAKTNTNAENFNRKFVKLLTSLNNSLITIYDNQLPSGYLQNLSHKYTKKNCNRTIANMQKNLSKLQNIRLSIRQNFKLKLCLRRFNKKLDRIL